MKECFEAGIFKVLVQDNFYFIRVDLDKAAHYFSRNPLRTKNALASFAAHRSRRLFEAKGAIEKIRTQYGYQIAPSSLPYFSHVYLGNSDMSSPIAFTKEMSEFYILLFRFKNDPPISISEFP